jgi:hypothetical protein
MAKKLLPQDATKGAKSPFKIHFIVFLNRGMAQSLDFI